VSIASVREVSEEEKTRRGLKHGQEDDRSALSKSTSAFSFNRTANDRFSFQYQKDPKFSIAQPHTPRKDLQTQLQRGREIIKDFKLKVLSEQNK